MKNKLGKLYIFIAILISFLLIACSAYSHCDKLIEVDFLSSHPSFENHDLESLVADKQNKAKIIVQSSFPIISFSMYFCSERFPHVSSPILSPNGSTSILRR